MPLIPVSLRDEPFRRAAIAGHERSALVEAGAGSGKTAVLAGRVAMMLMDGAAPKAIAAVTFTELAASELLSRVRDFVAKLLNGGMPRELQSCLPAGLSAEQRQTLATAAETIDEIACTTIHGFCQRLIKPYPAEADIDPGAQVADAGQADLLFEEVKDAWLRERLSEPEGGLLAELVSADVDKTLKLVDTILGCLRKHPALQAPATTDLALLTASFVGAVNAFHDHVENGPISEPESREIAGHFRNHAKSLPPGSPSSPAEVMTLLRLSPDESLFTKGGNFLSFRRKGKWAAAGKSAGVSKFDCDRLHDAAADLYAGCCQRWALLQGAIGSHALAMLLEELRPAIDRYQAQKRAAGLLDFDDLIHSALRLLRSHEEVRQALGRRYSRVLVDEFQDTDPQQTEIFWRLCGDPVKSADAADWHAFAIRPGALFLVGDPKQAIYRFRGADVAAYVKARELFEGAGATTLISTNFRSRPKILSFVNERFRAALAATGQPGFAELDAFHADHHEHCGAVALPVDVSSERDKPSAETRRDAEAEAVADMCERMIGHVAVRDRESGELRPCRAGDIALLAPTGTELWRYEAALEDRGLAVASQAGKGFFQQQEVQDLIALTRAVADGRDTLALGAFLRGPMVGLTEEQLLDIVWALPRAAEKPDTIPPLSLNIEPEQIADAYARDVFSKLRQLRRLANSTTPHRLLSQAFDTFHVRAMILRRYSRQAGRAQANVDLYLESSKTYAVRGLRAFAEAMSQMWEAARSEGGRTIEGRVDVQDEAVSVYSMHASKGLEWPIVVPINTMGNPRAIASEVVDRVNGLLYAAVFDIRPSGYADAHAAEKAEVERERVRLWYVAATRARDLLVLPRHSIPVAPGSWGGLVQLALEDLPTLELPAPRAAGKRAGAVAINRQTEAVWASEAAAIAALQRPLRWTLPSLNEGDETADAADALWTYDESPDETPIAVRGGRERGLVMHKLFEEVLNGETDERADVLARRAETLIGALSQTSSNDPMGGLSASEIANVVVKAFALPEIAALRPALTPELPVYSYASDIGGDVATAGVADAVSYDAAGKPDVIVDWKSDVAPSQDLLKHYRAQVRDYIGATGARAGLIVLATRGVVIKVEP